jgi:hypothetical protein
MERKKRRSSIEDEDKGGEDWFEARLAKQAVQPAIVEREYDTAYRRGRRPSPTGRERDRVPSSNAFHPSYPLPLPPTPKKKRKRSGRPRPKSLWKPPPTVATKPPVPPSFSPPPLPSPSPEPTHLVLTAPPPFHRLHTDLSTLQVTLNADGYAPYILLSLPIDPSRSFAYGRTLLRFLEALSPSSNWSDTSTSHLFLPSPPLSPALEAAGECRLNVNFIRSSFPLGKKPEASGAMAAKERGKDLQQWLGLREVLTWIYGELEGGWETVAWAVEELPTPLFVLCASPLPPLSLLCRLELRR